MTTHGEGRVLASAEFSKRQTSLPTKYVWNGIVREHVFPVTCFCASSKQGKILTYEKTKNTVDSEETFPLFTDLKYTN